MTCIYCASTGPFTDEHVIPAGLGGDDKRWLLKGVVCGVCNTEIFSALETKLMRASPLAVARLFYQSQTRDRGSKTAAPSIQAPVSYFNDPDTGMLLEQELGSRGQSTILPQVIAVPPNQLGVTAADVPAANRLVAELGSLGDTLMICRKERDGLEVRFHLTDLIWREGHYVVGDCMAQSKAPRQAIWLEPLERPVTAPTALLTPRVFRRAKGPLVCRAASIEHAAMLLTCIRIDHAAIIVPAEAQVIATPEPGIHFRQVFDAKAYDRALAKIAFNLCAYLFGPDAVRKPVFDNARRFARHGIGSVPQWPQQLLKERTRQFPPLPQHHLMVVAVTAPSEGADGAVSVLMQFYGGPFRALVMATGSVDIPVCPQPIFVVTDYEQNAIRRYSMEEFSFYAVGQLQSSR